MLLSEGVMPDNAGRGHVLRRLIRRASLYAYQSGLRKPQFANLLDLLIHELREPYPELAERRAHIASVLETEELAFFNVFERALVRFEQAVSHLKGDDRQIGGIFYFLCIVVPNFLL